MTSNDSKHGRQDVAMQTRVSKIINEWKFCFNYVSQLLIINFFIILDGVKD